MPFPYNALIVSGVLFVFGMLGLILSLLWRSEVLQEDDHAAADCPIGKSKDCCQRTGRQP